MARGGQVCQRQAVQEGGRYHAAALMRIVRMEYGSAGLRCPALPVYIRIINAVMMISPPMQNMCMGVCSDRSETCRYVHIFGLSIWGIRV